MRRLTPFAVKIVDRPAGEFAWGDTVATNRLLVSQPWRLPWVEGHGRRPGAALNRRSVFVMTPSQHEFPFRGALSCWMISGMGEIEVVDANAARFGIGCQPAELSGLRIDRA